MPSRTNLILRCFAPRSLEGRTVVLAAFLAAMLAPCPLPAAAQAVVQDIGGERVMFAGPSNPRAIIFVFAGGDGAVAFNSAGQVTHLGANFLIRTQPLWQAQGFAYATLGSSSSLFGRRHTPAYAETLARAIGFARTRANAPVLLVGTSPGAIAAPHRAAHL